MNEQLKVRVGGDISGYEAAIGKMISLAKGASVALVGVWGISKVVSEIKNLVTESTSLAARYTTLGIVADQVSRNIGVGSTKMEEYNQALQKTGISMIESRKNLIDMAQANLDLSRSTNLARIAQDSAVIGQIGSSEAFARMITGIQRGNTLILRGIGLNVDFEKSYRKLALELGTTKGLLNQKQIMQARMNAVDEEGIAIQGVYLAAMTTASKLLGSLTTRLLPDFKLEFGKAFEKAHVVLIQTAIRAIERLSEIVKDPEFQKNISDMAIGFAGWAKGLASFGVEVVGMASYMRSISTVAKEGAQLAQLGMLNMLEFTRKNFIERQEMVDETMKREGIRNATILEAMVDIIEAEEKLKKISFMGEIRTDYHEYIKTAQHEVSVKKEVLKMRQADIVVQEKAAEVTKQQEIYATNLLNQKSKIAKEVRDVNEKLESDRLLAAQNAPKIMRENLQIENSLNKIKVEEQEKLLSYTTSLMELSGDREADIVRHTYDTKRKLLDEHLEYSQKTILLEEKTRTDAERNVISSTKFITDKQKVLAAEVLVKREELDRSETIDRIKKAIEQNKAENDLYKEFLDAKFKLQVEFEKEYRQIGMAPSQIAKDNLDIEIQAWKDAGIEKEKITKMTAERIKVIYKQQLNDIREVAGTMADNFKTIAEMGGRYSKESFAMYKAFKIVETTISTYSAAIKAYEALVGIPIIGPYIAPVAAAAAVAFGMAQVAAIKSAKSPSYDKGGISTTPGIYYSGVPEAHIPLQSGGKVPVTINEGSRSEQLVQIIMNNPVFQDQETQRRVFQQIAENIVKTKSPIAIKDNYFADGITRSMIRSRA